MLDSLTKQGRKFKQRLRGKKNKPDKTGVKTAEETIDSSSSHLQPVPHIAASGHSGAGSRANTDEQQTQSGNRSPQPEPVSVGGKEADVDESEVSEERSRPDPDANIVEASGPSLEAELVYPSLLGPSIPLPTGEPESALTLSFQTLHLTILSGDTGATTPDHVPEVIHPNESAEPSTVVDEKKSDWKSTASATAKLILRGVRDSADVFGPLKSVAGGLCFILENCEVGPPLYTPQRRLHTFQRTKENEEMIVSLVPRVKTLSELLCGPVSVEDPKEGGRRKKLDQ